MANMISNQQNMKAECKKKKVFWLIMLSFPIIILLLIEFALRLLDYGDNLNLVFQQEINQKKYYTINQTVARRYFPKFYKVAPKVYDDSFEFKKSEKTFRVFCLGESTMQGFPYEYNGALPRLLKDRLIYLFPEKNIEVINLGITAVNSYAILDLIKDVVNFQPDLIILYVGHNEFYGTFGVGSVEYLGKNRAFVKAYLKLVRFKIFQLVRNSLSYVLSLIQSNSSKPVPPRMMELMAHEKSIPYRSDLYERAKNNFKENLSDIANIAKKHNIQILLSTVVSNIRHQTPFISEFSPTISDEQKEQWEKLFSLANEEFSKGDVEKALEVLLSAKEIDSLRADLHFAIGECLEQMNDLTSAKTAFERARDLDALRFRASGEFNDVIRNIVKEHRLLLADIENVFETNSVMGLVGKELMLEHVHPNLDGYSLIAKEYAHLICKNYFISGKTNFDEGYSDDYFKEMTMLTQFDIEVSLIRLDILLSQWPFSLPDSLRYKTQSVEGKFALDYVNGNIKWDDAHYRMAEMYKMSGRLFEAEREYRALAKILWYDYQPLMMAGDINLGLKYYSTAYNLYSEAIKRARNQFILARFGALYYETGQPDSAIYYFKSAISFNEHAASKFLKEHKAQILFHLAKSYLQVKDTANTLNVLSDALRTLPQYNEARILYNSLREQKTH